ncbi:MAG: PaaI family thioesterase, partial [Hyphomicrobiales bacterium]
MTEKLTRDQIQAILDGSPFISFCGMTCEEVWPDEDKVLIRMPMRPELERSPGSGMYHGGPIASLIDVAGDF